LSSWEDLVQSVWELGETTSNPNEWRKDVCGAWIYRKSLNQESEFGWVIDRIKPISLGGNDDISNYRPMHWENNKIKGNSPEPICIITSEGSKNIKVQPKFLKYCPSCASELIGDEKICKKCGNNIEAILTGQTVTTTKRETQPQVEAQLVTIKKRRGKRNIFFGFILILVFFITYSVQSIPVIAVGAGISGIVYLLLGTYDYLTSG
jgi:hypothetical protein